jgi:nucleoside-diphosphate-sugar epimerase
MKVLFIGGTGVLSSACSDLAVERGMEVYHLNRGKTACIRNIKDVNTFYADIRNISETSDAIRNHDFDVVVDFLSYEPKHIQNAMALFTGKTKQYILISTASAYQTPEVLPVTEDTPLDNPFWEYSRNKIACENVLKDTAFKSAFPFTIVRPSHTYDKTKIPAIGGYTVLHRMLKGEAVILPGDGTSIWTLTWNADFAVGLVGLFGKKEALGESFHITSNEWLTWNQIYNIMAQALGVKPIIVHIPSNIIAKYDAEIGASLLGDKSNSMLFDNSKIRKVVPEFNPTMKFRDGANAVIKWYLDNTSHLPADNRFNTFMDRIVGDYHKLDFRNY